MLCFNDLINFSNCFQNWLLSRLVKPFLAMFSLDLDTHADECLNVSIHSSSEQNVPDVDNYVKLKREETCMEVSMIR